jgi:hypothetical protein
MFSRIDPRYVVKVNVCDIYMALNVTLNYSVVLMQLTIFLKLKSAEILRK